ncbi:MAG: magnesium/cobalt transporter CorA [Cyanobacteria bacterium J06627_15]
MTKTGLRPPTQLPDPPGDEERRHWDYHYDEVGSLPGTLVIEPDAVPPHLVLIDYRPDRATLQTPQYPADCLSYLRSDSVSWLDVQGLGSEAVLRQMGEVFRLHPLVLEDVVNVPQRPKVESYDQQMLIIARMVVLKPDELGFESEQVSFVLGESYLLTVQEEPQVDCFDPVRDRIRFNRGLIREKQADYLVYSLLDAIVDGFFPILEAYGEHIEDLEDEVIFRPTRQTVQKIYQVRRDLMTLRRSIWPQRNAINGLMREDCSLISPEVRVYLHDCYDHAVQVLDIVETYRELTSTLMDVYLSSVSNRMNEVMKTLTVISSIFIPLTFIAGVYGMNFNPAASPWNMPELNAYFGYPLCWLVMILISGGLTVYFWRQGWFENISS